MKKFIGLSLSLCMMDILRGYVLIDDIAAIVTSTKFQSQEEAFDYYYNCYWKSLATKEIARNTLKSVWHLICQPRLSNGGAGHMCGHGIWLNTETGELKKHLKP